MRNTFSLMFLLVINHFALAQSQQTMLQQTVYCIRPQFAHDLILPWVIQAKLVTPTFYADKPLPKITLDVELYPRRPDSLGIAKVFMAAIGSDDDAHLAVCMIDECTYQKTAQVVYRKYKIKDDCGQYFNIKGYINYIKADPPYLDVGKIKYYKIHRHGQIKGSSRLGINTGGLVSELIRQYKHPEMCTQNWCAYQASNVLFGGQNEKIKGWTVWEII